MVACRQCKALLKILLPKYIYLPNLCLDFYISTLTVFNIDECVLCSEFCEQNQIVGKWSQFKLLRNSAFKTGRRTRSIENKRKNGYSFRRKNIKKLRLYTKVLKFQIWFKLQKTFIALFQKIEFRTHSFPSDLWHKPSWKIIPQRLWTDFYTPS